MKTKLKKQKDDKEKVLFGFPKLLIKGDSKPLSALFSLFNSLV